MRVSLVVPFNIFNYVMGTTSIKFSHFMIGSTSMIFTNTLEVFLGSSISHLSDIIQGKYHGSVLFEVMLVVGMVTALTVIVSITLITRH